MLPIPTSVADLLAGSPLGHLVTMNKDGSPQVSVVWVGIEDGELVVASIGARQKLRNVERDPRVAVSFEGQRSNELGLREYLVVHGTARVTDGGAPETLQRLAHGYLGPDVTFPPMPDPPPGRLLRIAPDRFGGVGPWAVT
jgi:PPOX class probable F420-dependent enzyme